jgi:hypothetical protein
MGTAGFLRPPDDSPGTVPEVNVGLDVNGVELDVNGVEQQLRVDARVTLRRQQGLI